MKRCWVSAGVAVATLASMSEASYMAIKLGICALKADLLQAVITRFGSISDCQHSV